MTGAEDSRLVAILEGLVRRTHAHSIEWERRNASTGADQFDFSTTESTVSISSQSDGKGAPVYEMTVKNRDGMIVGVLSTDELPRRSTIFRRSTQTGKQLETLFILAQESSLRIDKTLDKSVLSSPSGG